MEKRSIFKLVESSLQDKLKKKSIKEVKSPSFKIENKKVGDVFVSSFGGWEFEHGSEVESEEDIGWGYSNGDEPYDAVKNVDDFIGINFHLIQQLGGKLTYKGKEVKAVSPEDTLGNPTNADTQVNYNGKKVNLGSLTKV